MAKASPITNALNAGVFSPLMEGRTDASKYKASMRRALNFILAPQGPAMRRVGTELITPVYNDAKQSALIPFIFASDDAQQLEFSDFILRFITNAGLTTYAPAAITAVTPGANFVFTSAALAGTVVGDQVAFSGFPATSGLNGAVGTVSAVAAGVYTVAWPYGIAQPGLTYVAGMQVAKVFAIASPYAQADVKNIRYCGDQDIIYLFCPGYRNYQLARYGAYDWRFSVIEFTDGPYLPINDTSTRLTPSGRGCVSTEPADGTAFGSAGTFANAFTASATGNWDSGAAQSGTLGFNFTTPVAIATYTIFAQTSSSDANYYATDYAPSTWTFEASNDGVTYTVLDIVTNYVLWDNGRSVTFKTKNTAVWKYYRLVITACKRNGPIDVIIRKVIFGPVTPIPFTITASAVTGINFDQGFKATDVGRLIRYQNRDANWRALVITGYTSSTVVTVRAQNEPLFDMLTTTEWRLGIWSDTTGWPICGVFFEDRLFLGGAVQYPNYIVGSVNGSYTNMAQTDAAGAVQDDSAVVIKPKSRKLQKVRWLQTDERGLLIGTQSGEWVFQTADTQAALTAKNGKVRQPTARGSANIEPVKVDRQVLFVQASKRTLREMAYVYQADGYSTPSMSLFSSHLGAPNFEEIEYAAEPHSIAWVRRGDGLVAGFTYNREEEVVGWHLHDFGGVVENFSVIPSADGTQDILWLVVARVINGVTRRYIERMTSSWQDASTLDTAHFVDCGLRYQGPAADTFRLPHLAGKTICGLVDGSPFSPVVAAADGLVTLGFTGTNVVLGLGYDSIGETSRPEAGSADGTSQGKTKRNSRVVIRLWQSAAGQVGRGPNPENPNDELVDIVLRGNDDFMDTALPLFSGDYEVQPFPGGYDYDGTIVFKQPAENALPFNVIAIMPQIETQDR